MSDTRQKYWQKKLAGYKNEPWADKPTYFAQEAIKYFPATGRLLELGAGLSQDSTWYASQGYDVIATDLMELQPRPGIKALQLDMAKPLPFAAGSFDVVYAHLSLHYFSLERTQALFDEIYTILKPGGVFAFLVNSTHDPELDEGKEIEVNYRTIKGIQKRFFDTAITEQLTTKFETIILDDQGTSHKDKAKGIANLVRFVGRKST